MASSGASTAATTTPARRGGTDMAWEWGVCKDPTNKNYVWCKFCDKRVSGGIYRLKEHLMHKPGNTTGCGEVPNDVRKKVEAAMRKSKQNKLKKGIIQNNLSGFNDEDEVEEIPGIDEHDGPDDEQTGNTNVSQTCGGSGVGSGSSVPSTRKRKGPSNVRGPLDTMLKPDLDKLKQARLDANNPHKEHLKKIAWMRLAEWAYEVGLPFNAVRPASFAAAMHAVGDYGRFILVPSYHNMRVTLLKEVLQNTKTFVDSFRVHWTTYGCSIMSDFWTDTKGRSLINFLVNCPKGTIFLKSIDASEHVKDANLIVGMINEVIADVGEENIIQFITDNGSNFKAAGRILEEQHPKLFWTPCAAHCANLMLAEIGDKITKISKVVVDARAVVVYIYNRARVLSIMRKMTNNKELHRSCVTRFATTFYTLSSMWENKHSLQIMFVSEDWARSSYAKTREGMRAERIIGRKDFWEDVHFACQVLAPLVDVVRLVDTEERPCMGYIYEAMDRAKEQIQKNLGSETREQRVMCGRIWAIIDRRWDDQLHHPLHAAGFYLNPSIYYKQATIDIETNREIKSGLYNAIDKLVPDDTENDIVRNQLDRYMNAEGVLGSPSAVRQREKMAPYRWWLAYGIDVPNLQKFAIKILSQTCSASPCERNWSAFDHLHSKKRNCLLQAKLNDLVFIQYNKKLEQRFLRNSATGGGKARDPIILMDVDDNDEWIIPTDEELDGFVREGDDLRWETVRRASGVEEHVGPSTRSRSATQSVFDMEDDEDVQVDGIDETGDVVGEGGEDRAQEENDEDVDIYGGED